MNFRIKNCFTVYPPGGWQYSEGGWTAPNPLSNGFREQMVNISNFRRQNPRLGLNPHLSECEQALHNFTAARLNYHVKYVEGKDGDSKKNSSIPLPRFQPESKPAPQGVVSRFFSRLANDLKGVATLARWMGNGGDPVEPAVAANRAQACLRGNGGNPCPHNQPGNAVESGIANEILEQTALRKKLDLTIPGEIGLKSCELCGCHLPLKVWVPDPADLKNRPPWCWQKSAPVRFTGRPKINVHRGGAFGDVIQASTLADALDEFGYDVHFLAGEAERVCLEGHPSIASLEPADGVPTIELDWAYERSPDFATEHIQTLLHRMNGHGLHHCRVPQLHVNDTEKQEARNALSGLKRPIVGVIARAGAWPNRQTESGDWKLVAEALPDVTFVNFGPSPLPSPIRNINVNGFRRVMALIGEVDMVATVDTGPMHVAAALRKPMVVVEGPFRIDLRLTDGTDYALVKAPVPCVGCMKYRCEIHDPLKPPCQRLDVDKVTWMIQNRLKMKGVAVLIPSMSGQARIDRVIKSVIESVSDIVVGMDGAVDPYSFTDASPYVLKNPTGKRNGFGKTCNRMARHSSGEFLFFLNDDCYMDPGAVETMLKQFDDPSVAVVGCKTRYPNGRLYFAGARRPENATNFGHIQDDRFTQPTEMEFVNFAAAIVRRSAFFSVGGFDDRYDCYAEDADLCTRLRIEGWKVMFEPSATGIHDESQTTSPMKIKLLTDGNALFDKRWRSYFLNTTPLIP